MSCIVSLFQWYGTCVPLPSNWLSPSFSLSSSGCALPFNFPVRKADMIATSNKLISVFFQHSIPACDTSEHVMQGSKRDSNYLTVARASKSMNTVSGIHLVFCDISGNSELGLYLFCMGYVNKKDSDFVKLRFSGVVET